MESAVGLYLGRAKLLEQDAASTSFAAGRELRRARDRYLVRVMVADENLRRLYGLPQ